MGDQQPGGRVPESVLRCRTGRVRPVRSRGYPSIAAGAVSRRGCAGRASLVIGRTPVRSGAPLHQPRVRTPVPTRGELHPWDSWESSSAGRGGWRHRQCWYRAQPITLSSHSRRSRTACSPSGLREARLRFWRPMQGDCCTETRSDGMQAAAQSSVRSLGPNRLRTSTCPRGIRGGDSDLLSFRFRTRRSDWGDHAVSPAPMPALLPDRNRAGSSRGQLQEAGSRRCAGPSIPPSRPEGERASPQATRRGHRNPLWDCSRDERVRLPGRYADGRRQCRIPEKLRRPTLSLYRSLAGRCLLKQRLRRALGRLAETRRRSC